MTTKYTIELTCDACGAKSESAYSWARIDISGSTDALVFMPNQHFDTCPDCWKKMRRVIYPPREKASS